MKRAATIFALVAALALPGLTVAATTTTESLTVNPQALTLDGIPTTLDYGATDPGVTATTPTFHVSVTCTSGCQLVARFTDLTGPGTIPVSARLIYVSNVTGTRFGTNFDPAKAPGVEAGANVNLFGASAPGGTGSADFTFAVNVPAHQAAGVYTGSVLFILP